MDSVKTATLIRAGLVLCLILAMAQCTGPSDHSGTQAAGARVLLVGQSRYAYAETVERISSAAVAAGWKIPVTHDLQASLRNAGKEILPTTVIELCNPAVSYRVLRSDSLREVSALMPCRVSVYERHDGSVLVSRMDPTAFEGVFGGEAATAMREAGEGIETILSDILQEPVQGGSQP